MYIFSVFSELLKKCETKARVFDNARNTLNWNRKLKKK